MSVCIDPAGVACILCSRRKVSGFLFSRRRRLRHSERCEASGLPSNVPGQSAAPLLSARRYAIWRGPANRAPLKYLTVALADPVRRNASKTATMLLLTCSSGSRMTLPSELSKNPMGNGRRSSPRLAFARTLPSSRAFIRCNCASPIVASNPSKSR